MRLKGNFLIKFLNELCIPSQDIPLSNTEGKTASILLPLLSVLIVKLRVAKSPGLLSVAQATNKQTKLPCESPVAKGTS